jgi:hypothetical protein
MSEEVYKTVWDNGKTMIVKTGAWFMPKFEATVTTVTEKGTDENGDVTIEMKCHIIPGTYKDLSNRHWYARLIYWCWRLWASFLWGAGK